MTIHPVFGQKYSAVYKGGDGEWLKGDVNYKPRVPVKDFWALTVYDIGTRALIKTDQHIAEINSGVTKLISNQDGSIDLYFGPTAPTSVESNWIKTNNDKPWFAYFRWYGPLDAYYDQSWKLPDIEPFK